MSITRGKRKICYKSNILWMKVNRFFEIHKPQLKLALLDLVYDYFVIKRDMIPVIRGHDLGGGVESLSTLGSWRTLVWVKFQWHSQGSAKNMDVSLWLHGSFGASNFVTNLRSFLQFAISSSRSVN